MRALDAHADPPAGHEPLADQIAEVVLVTTVVERVLARVLAPVLARVSALEAELARARGPGGRRWLKAREAAHAWAGGLSVKLLYAAVHRGDLKAAPVGAGRNLLFCEEWMTEWLTTAAERLARRADAPRARPRPASAAPTMPARARASNPA